MADALISRRGKSFDLWDITKYKMFVKYDVGSGTYYENGISKYYGSITLTEVGLTTWQPVKYIVASYGNSVRNAWCLFEFDGQNGTIIIESGTASSPSISIENNNKLRINNFGYSDGKVNITLFYE